MRGDSVKIKNCRGGFKICGESIRKILEVEKIVYGVATISTYIRHGRIQGKCSPTRPILLYDLKSSANRLKKVLTFPSIFI